MHRVRVPSPMLRLAAAAAAIAWPLTAFGQLPVTDYSFTVAPSSNYANANLTVLTNGTSQVNVWPNSADTAQLVGWNGLNPGIQFNFTGGQSVSDVTVWAANSKGSAGVWLPFTVTITSGTFTKTLTVTPPTGSGTTTPLTITGISAAADSFTITAGRDTVGSPGGWTMFSEVQFFGTGAKAANTNTLNLASSWTGNRAPVSTDVVLFNTTFTLTTALDTGTAVDWSGMKVTGGSGALTIDPSSTANRLGIGTSGIDLSAATRDVRLADLRLTGSTAQPWSIAAGRSLTVGADSLTQGTGANPVLSGSGTLVKEGESTGLTLGSLTTFTGTLVAQSGSLTTSAANQLTGNFGVNLAAGTTLRLGGNDTLPTSMNSGSGTIEILASNTMTISNASARTVDRVFAGAGRITKTGTGTLTLSGSTSHSGGTVIAGGAGANGILRIGSNSALGTGTVTISGSNAGSGSVLDLNGATISTPIAIQALGSGVADTGAIQNTNASTTAVVNGPVVIGGGNYVGGDGSITFNGVISGGTSIYYSLYKQGIGTWTFANPANTFEGFYYQIGGVTEVTRLANAGEASSLGQVSVGNNLFVFGFGSGGGTLRYVGSTASTSDKAFSLRGATAASSNVIEAAGTSPTATLTLTGPLSAGAAGSYSATLTGTNEGVNVYAGTIGNGSGSVSLVKQGSTTWALTGANSYTGATTVSSGTLKVGNSGSTGTLGGGGVSVAAGAMLAFDRSDSGLVVSDIISGSGTVMQIGSGTTSLTGASTYTSPTEIAAGTLRVGNGSTAGTLGSGSVAIAAGAALAFNRSDAITVSNAIGGAGAVVKQSANTLTLTGSSSYSGGTRLTAGTLIVGSDQALGTGTLAFATAGATLQTARNVLVPIAVESSGTLAIVGSGVDLTANFSGGATLTKTGTGTLTLSGPASTFSGNLVIAGGAGANSIVRAGNTAAFGTGTVTILGSGGNTGSTFDLNGQSLDNSLVIGLGNSGVNDAGALMNSNAAVPATLNGAVSLGGEIYVGGAGSITFSGLVSGTVNPANAYSLYKDGAGTWTFASTANTFDGFYYQVGGVTEVAKLANINEPSSLGQPTTSGRNRVSFGFGGNGGGTLRFVGSAASTSDREFVLSGGTAASSTVIEASGASAAATLTLTGNLSANRAGSYAATLGGTNAGVNEYRGVIGNGSATVSLVKDGSTIWALTAVNTYTGSTTITAGTLQVGTGGTAGELGGTGAIANDGVLAMNRSDAVTLSRVINGSGAFHQLGSGTTTLSGNNAFTGGAAINAGVLAIGSTAALGSTGPISFGGGTLRYSASNTTDYSSRFSNAAGQQYAIDTNGQNITLASNLTSSGGSFAKLGTGTMTLSGSNSYSGVTTVTAGRLIGSAASLPGDVANAAALEFAQAVAGTFSAAISGTGSLTKTGVGNLILAGSSSYTGATSVEAGRLSVNGVLGTSPVAVLVAAELGGSGSIAGPVSIAAGGTLSPGNSIESLATGTTTFAAGATFAYEVDSTNPLSLSSAADLLVVSGDLNLDLGNGSLLTLADLASSVKPFVEDTTIFALINYSGSWNGGLFTYNGNVLADGSQFMVGTQEWEIDYNRTSPAGLANFTGDYLPNSSFVTVTAVPEPSTLVLMAIGAGLAAVAGFRRRAFVR